METRHTPGGTSITWNESRLEPLLQTFMKGVRRNFRFCYFKTIFLQCGKTAIFALKQRLLWCSLFLAFLYRRFCVVQAGVYQCYTRSSKRGTRARSSFLLMLGTRSPLQVPYVRGNRSHYGLKKRTYRHIWFLLYFAYYIPGDFFLFEQIYYENS